MGEDTVNIPGAEGIVEIALVQYHADVRFCQGFPGEIVLSQKGNLARIPADQV